MQAAEPEAFVGSVSKAADPPDAASSSGLPTAADGPGKDPGLSAAEEMAPPAEDQQLPSAPNQQQERSASGSPAHEPTTAAADIGHQHSGQHKAGMDSTDAQQPQAAALAAAPLAEPVLHTHHADTARRIYPTTATSGGPHFMHVRQAPYLRWSCSLLRHVLHPFVLLPVAACLPACTGPPQSITALSHCKVKHLTRCLGSRRPACCDSRHIIRCRRAHSPRTRPAPAASTCSRAAGTPTHQ